MNKMISLEDAVNKIQDRMTVMVGGFWGAAPSSYYRQAGRKDEDLTLICNDTGFRRSSERWL